MIVWVAAGYGLISAALIVALLMLGYHTSRMAPTSCSDPACPVCAPDHL